MYREKGYSDKTAKWKLQQQHISAMYVRVTQPHSESYVYSASEYIYLYACYTLHTDKFTHSIRPENVIIEHIVIFIVIGNVLQQVGTVRDHV